MPAASFLYDGIDPPSHARKEPSSVRRAPSPTSRTSFNSLPVEIVSLVFMNCIQDGFYPVEPRIHLKLGKICKRWRQIAWSNPTLWTNLIIHGRHATSHTHAVLAEEWLSRSGTLPLTIEVVTYPDDWNCPWQTVLQGCKEILGVLSRYSHRWHSLTLSVPPTCMEEMETLSPVPSALHYLSLTAVWDDFKDPELVPRISTFSKCTPKIVQLRCLNAELDWKLLTSLTFDLIEIAEMLYIFRTASNLSECTVDVTSDVDSNSLSIFNRGLIICPVLQSLSIFFSDEDSSEVFCSIVSLPCLKHLSFHGRDVDLSMDDLILFLTQSSCSLESLVIDESEYEEHRLIDLAPLLPSLTDLRILSTNYDHGSNDTDTFYHFLSDPNRLPPHFLPPSYSTTLPYLPYLKTFYWEGPAPYPWETLPGLYKPIIHDTISHYRPLKSVKIVSFEKKEADIPYIPKEIVQQLLVFTDVKFDFILKTSRYEYIGTDLWKASLEKLGEE